MRLLHSVGLGALISCLSVPAIAAVDTVEEDESEDGASQAAGDESQADGESQAKGEGQEPEAEEDESNTDDGKGEKDGGAAIADTKSAGVLIEPLLAIFGFFEGEVDITIDDNIAIGIWGQYFDYSIGDTGIGGYGVGVGAPIFLTGQTYKGMYIYPLFKFQQVQFSVPDVETVTATYYGPLVTVGYQWSWSAFSLKLGGGLEYSLGKLESSSIDQELSFEGIDYELDALIGVVF